MGEEGRVPPPLDGVGAKLTLNYLKQILDKGAHDRPYMHTRMPGFGLANVGPIATAFAASDKLEATPPVTFVEPMAKVKAAARHMAGGNCLGCVKCHTFAGQKAEGVQGIDMLLMPKRVQRDWFHALPDRSAEASARHAHADRLAQRQDRSCPTCSAVKRQRRSRPSGSTSTTPKPQLPVGLQKRSIPLLAEKNAVLYRNFIQGSGTRAIGVGYPEKANLSFDANEMRLALLWQGAFMDAARHWSGRGEGYEAPLGDNILVLPAGATFASLPDGKTPWPTTAPKAMGYKFLGYRLTPDDRPTFLYSFGDLKVEDFPNAMADKEGSLKRTLVLTASKPVEDLYFRAAVGNKIEALEGGWYRMDGWKIKLEGVTPKVRESGGKKELLAPVRFTDGKAQIVQHFVW